MSQLRAQDAPGHASHDTTGGSAERPQKTAKERARLGAGRRARPATGKAAGRVCRGIDLLSHGGIGIKKDRRHCRGRSQKSRAPARAFGPVKLCPGDRFALAGLFSAWSPRSCGSAARCEPLKKDIEAREQALMQFALARREELFKGRKSRELTFGTIGFRVSSSLRTIKKMTWERVLGVLRERGMTNCIRIKEEVDKEALRTLGPNTLADVGCKLVQEDGFFYELNETELEGNRT